MSTELEVEASAPEQEPGPDRRSLMKAAALAAVPVAGVGTVAACSSGGSGKSSGGTNGSPVTVPSSSVPVGGGFVDTTHNIVVTQPAAGTFKAFTAVCPHQGCTVKEVADNQIHCPCHGSIFSAQDGSVLTGPATAPLAAMTATAKGTDVEVTGSAH